MKKGFQNGVFVSRVLVLKAGKLVHRGQYNILIVRGEEEPVIRMESCSKITELLTYFFNK